ncbi:MAG: hypothetical protein M3472_02810 [Chloroflexota bacterium]|nr:hypothetical protein [Chloroflexota bacterium]
MDEDRYPRAIRRAFEPFRMSVEATLPARIPGEATSSLRFSRLPRLALPIAAVAVAAVMAVTALAPARPAFASWQPVPTGADPAAVSAAEDACRRSDPDHLAVLELVGSEQRGAYTMLLFTDGEGGAYGLCLTGEGIEPLVFAGSGPSSGMVDAPMTGDGSSAHTGSPGGHHGTPSWSDLPPVHFVAMPADGEPNTQQVQTFVFGLSSEVARLEVERVGAEPAVATLVDSGMAFVWWPAGPTAGDYVAYDAEGRVLERYAANFLSH